MFWLETNCSFWNKNITRVIQYFSFLLKKYQKSVYIDLSRLSLRGVNEEIYKIN